MTLGLPDAPTERLAERLRHEDPDRFAMAMLAPPEARARLAAQWPIDEKVRRADYVIRTDGRFADTDAGIRRVHDALMQASAG